jgi:hypothetical protein
MSIGSLFLKKRKMQTEVSIKTSMADFENNCFLFLKTYADVTGGQFSVFIQLLYLLLESGDNYLDLTIKKRKDLIAELGINKDAFSAFLNMLIKKAIIKVDEDNFIRLMGNYDWKGKNKIIEFDLLEHNIKFEIYGDQ